MTTRTCHAPGCTRATTRYGRFCSTHKGRLRRHGAATQKAVTKSELRSYEKLARERIEKNRDNALWRLSEDAWREVVGRAAAITSSSGAGLRSERRAAMEALKLRDHVQPRAVLETVCAMFMLLYDAPRRFRSDSAFRLQLVRRVRGLTSTNAGQWFDAASGRMKRAYRELPPRAADCLAGWIISALGGTATIVARLEQQQRNEQERRALMMSEAVKDLR